ncbi:uncharacterized protein F4817DRAFT_282821 [Daldinia loculata]|uniref:uncharacterized protein n=1 Tax=Daldinia loculata TaxID=103429 RepID=UPI0020C49BE9|nr:uncharacterized protein F4817DRAFT_282821 [Daldinia loculata]KAI1650226.1 hypothetical protein F4817DRAFT_282821 [Daldinia loculata]
MASPRQGLVHDDSESLREDHVASSFNQGDEEVFDDQIGSGYAHQSVLDHKDKGKAPIRVHRDFVDRRYSQNAEIPNANPHSYTNPTNPESRNENLESPESSAASSVLNEPLSEHGIKLKTQLLSPKPSLEALSVESDCESFRTASPGLYLDDDQERKQEQGQDAESDREPEPQPYPADQDPVASGPHTNQEAGSPTFRPLRFGDPGWEKSADRPPEKLPIRFKDAVGRKFVFPWEKAKTWAGMERLIRNCFVYVDVIGPHVIKGHYDLFTFHLPFSTDTGFEMAPQAASEPVGVQHPGIEPHMAGTSNQPPIPHAPTPPPAPTLTPIEQSAVTILPELWEDLVEPGMFILMQMWPMAPPAMPPPPMQHPPGPPGILGYVGGRGRGRGSGGGRGMGPPLGPPPGWMVVERPPKPRGKTRKRRDGP